VHLIGIIIKRQRWSYSEKLRGNRKTGPSTTSWTKKRLAPDHGRYVIPKGYHCQPLFYVESSSQNWYKKVSRVKTFTVLL